MQPLSPITYPHIKGELEQVLARQNPLLLNEKIAHLTERLLKEMTIEELSTLENVVQSQPHPNSISGLFTDTMIKQLVASVKKSKKEVNKLEEIGNLLGKDQLDEAAALLNTIDPEFAGATLQIRNAIAQRYCSQGNYRKAHSLLSQKDLHTESVSESTKAQMGRELARDGLENLRRAFPENHDTLPSNSQFDSALKGLHEMSALSSGNATIDRSLEHVSIIKLNEMLEEAEKQLEQERNNYTEALKTHNPNVFMPALDKKQAVMKKVLQIKQALHQRGISQAEEGNPEEKINKAILDGFNELKSSVKAKIPDGDEEASCVIS